MASRSLHRHGNLSIEEKKHTYKHSTMWHHFNEVMVTINRWTNYSITYLYIYMYVCWPLPTTMIYITAKAAAALWKCAKCLLHIQKNCFTFQLKNSHLSTIIETLLWKVKHTPSYIRVEGEGERSPIWTAGPWLDCRAWLAFLSWPGDCEPSLYWITRLTSCSWDTWTLANNLVSIYDIVLEPKCQRYTRVRLVVLQLWITMIGISLRYFQHSGLKLIIAYHHNYAIVIPH